MAIWVRTRVRFWVTCTLAAVAAGCLGPQDSQPILDGEASDCPVRYPDNSRFDCDSPDVIRTGVSAVRPDVDTGWFCHVRNRNDDGYGVVDLLRTQDGRLGFWWTSTWEKPGGVMFAYASLFYPDGDGDVGVVAFQPSGFVELPFRARAATADVHTIVRHLRLDVKEADADWKEDPNATLLVGAFHGSPWWVWRYEIANATHFLDTMVRAPSASTYADYEAKSRFYEAEDHAAYATISGWGGKFLQIGTGFEPQRHPACSV